jgi:hypothetical protein
MLIDDGTKLRVVQFHNIYNRSFTNFERRMRKSNLTVHREMFRDTCLKTKTLFLKCKKDYFSKKISEMEHDQKHLHRLRSLFVARSSSEYHSVFGRSIMFFDFNGACLSMMELSSELYSFTTFTTTDLIQDLNNSKIVQNREGSVVNVVKLYNSELSSIIDKHAPLKSKNIILRPNTAWYLTDGVVCMIVLLSLVITTSSV